jgi:hypothetical protein
MAGNPFVREIPVDFPETMATHDVLASLWARLRVDDLMGQDWTGTQQGRTQDDLKKTITQVGIEYRLMTQFTSFVAVEEVVVTDGGQPRRIDVPIEMPEGVNMSGNEIVNRQDATLGIGFTARQIRSLPVNGRAATGLMTISGGVSSVTVPTGNAARNRGGGAAGGSGGGAKSKAPPPNMPGAVTATATVSPSPSATPTSSGAYSIDPGVQVLTPEQRAQQQLESKFHSSVLAVVQRVKTKNPIPAPEEATFVTGGKAELQIWMTDKNDEALAALKELGVEVIADPKTSRLLIARVAVEKLEALGQSKWVKYVAPSTKR